MAQGVMSFTWVFKVKPIKYAQDCPMNTEKTDHFRKQYFEKPYQGKFFYKFCDEQEFTEIYQDQFLNEYLPSQFIPQLQLNPIDVIRSASQTSAEINKHIHFDRIIIFDVQQNPVALFDGYQQKIDQYYMRNSVIKKEYRRMGLYNDYCKRLIQYTKALNIIHLTSLHHAYNNPIMIAKLKLGFYITGYQTDISWGNMVMMSYFNCEKYEELFKYRTGHRSFLPEFYEASSPRVQKFFESVSKKEPVNNI